MIFNFGMLVNGLGELFLMIWLPTIHPLVVLYIFQLYTGGKHLMQELFDVTKTT